CVSISRTPEAGKGKSGSFRPPSPLQLTLTIGAERRLRHHAEALHTDVAAAPFALPEGLRLAVQTAQRLVDPVEPFPFLAGEQELLLSLHRLSADIGHVKAIAAELPRIRFHRLRRLLLEGSDCLEG